jgi:hypothetical protein
MKRQIPTNSSPPPAGFDPEPLLHDWISTVTTFYHYYHLLARFVQCLPDAADPTSQMRLGQCTIKQIDTLLDRMQGELETLLEDMNQTQPAERNYQRLETHTKILSTLNQQAKELLVLTACWPC